MSAIADRCEERILGAILAAGAVGAGDRAMTKTLATGLRAEHFWRPSYGALFRVLVDMHGRDIDLSPLSVAAELERAALSRLGDLAPLVAEQVLDEPRLLAIVERLTHEPGAHISQMERLAHLVVEAAGRRSLQATGGGPTPPPERTTV